MYEAFFGLQSRPFAATPSLDAFVPLLGPVEAIEGVEQAVVGAAGIAVLTGPAGSGKTLACLVLADRLRDRFDVVHVPSGSSGSRAAFLQSLLLELNEPLVRLTDDELRLHLDGVIRSRTGRGNSIALLIDEAHLLDGAMLEDLRRLTHLVDDGRPLVRLVLVGRLELEEQLAEPGRDDFNQRIASHPVLDQFTRAESRTYLAERIERCGGRLENCFDDEATALIAEIADGSPRCLNQLADHALLLAHVDERRPVDAEVVLEAFDDLRQLPLPWNEPLRSSESGFESTSFEIGEAAPESEPAPPRPSFVETESATIDTPESEPVADDEPMGSSAIEFVDRTASEAPTITETPTDSGVVEVGWAADDAPLETTPAAAPDAETATAPEPVFDAGPATVTAAASADREQSLAESDAESVSPSLDESTTPPVDVVTEDVVTEDVVTEDVVTEDVVTEEVATEDVVAEEVVTEDGTTVAEAADDTDVETAAIDAESRLYETTTRIDVNANSDSFEWNEEFVTDRYATLDAGRPFEAPAATVAEDAPAENDTMSEVSIAFSEPDAESESVVDTPVVAAEEPGTAVEPIPQTEPFGAATTDAEEDAEPGTVAVDVTEPEAFGESQNVLVFEAVNLGLPEPVEASLPTTATEPVDQADSGSEDVAASVVDLSDDPETEPAAESVPEPDTAVIETADEVDSVDDSATTIGDLERVLPNLNDALERVMDQGFVTESDEAATSPAPVVVGNDFVAESDTYAIATPESVVEESVVAASEPGSASIEDSVPEESVDSEPVAEDPGDEDPTPDVVEPVAADVTDSAAESHVLPVAEDHLEARIADDVRELQFETRQKVLESAEAEYGAVPVLDDSSTYVSEAYDTIHPEDDGEALALGTAAEPVPAAASTEAVEDRPYARLFGMIRERYERE